jgi:hypothetical protein
VCLCGRVTAFVALTRDTAHPCPMRCGAMRCDAMHTEADDPFAIPRWVAPKVNTVKVQPGDPQWQKFFTNKLEVRWALRSVQRCSYCDHAAVAVQLPGYDGAAQLIHSKCCE